MRIRTINKLVRLIGVGGALLLPVLVPVLAWGDTAPLAGDAYINPAIGSNFGGLPGINVGGAPGSQGLLLFDLSNIPTNTPIAWARLRFYVNSVTTAGTIDVFTASTNWAESTVTGTSGVVANTPVQSGIPVTIPGFITIDVTSTAQFWINGGSNNGFFISTSPGTTSLTIDSKENASTSHAATLEIVLAGSAGPTGAPGAAGPLGPTGPTGGVGPTGSTGAAGAVGAAGPQGAAGPTGSQGPTGANGSTGNPGASGAAGPTGPIGPTGPTGANGSTGSLGAVGAAGAAGPTGPQGPTGFAGFTGTTGVTGNTGVTGPTGAIGNTGNVGAAGQAGAAGPNGITGSTGPAGIAGAQGATGNAGAVFSNTFDSLLITSGTTISAGATQHVFYVNNNSAPATVTMPPANVAGKYIRIMGTQVPGTNAITLNASGSDHFLECCTQTGVTSITGILRGIAWIADGLGHWYLAESQ
jgi:Collagen triple helix repeat (20 copies)